MPDDSVVMACGTAWDEMLLIPARWHRHFGPLSGSDPKLADPLARYVVITFTYGTNMGSYQASRHLRGLVSPHEISAPANQHTTPGKLNLASTDVINQYSRLEVTRLWGDGSRVAADGTQSLVSPPRTLPRVRLDVGWSLLQLRQQSIEWKLRLFCERLYRTPAPSASTFVPSLSAPIAPKTKVRTFTVDEEIQ